MTKRVKDNVLNRIESFELHHQIGFFVGVMILTIILTRLIVFLHNPNPVFLKFELHHFDYGLFLLVITVLMILFGKLRMGLSLSLIAVSLGWIIDDLWFIRSNFIDPSINEVEIYSATLPTVFVLTAFVLLIIVVIRHFSVKGGDD